MPTQHLVHRVVPIQRLRTVSQLLDCMPIWGWVGGWGGGGGQCVTTQCQTKADSFRQRMQHFAVSATFNPWIKQTVDLMLLCLGPNLILWSIEATKSHRKADPIWDQFNKR